MGVFSATKDRLLRKHRKKEDQRVADSDDGSLSASTAPETYLAGSSTSTSTPDFTSIPNHATRMDARKVEVKNNQGTQNDLWSKAFAMFQERDTEQKLLTAYTNYLASFQGESTSISIDFSNPEFVEGVVRNLLAVREQKQWKFHIRNHNISVREQLEKLGKLLLWSDSFVQTVVSTQPLAALAWSGVSLILPLILSSTTEKEDMANGLEDIGELQMFWQIFETEYLESDRRQHYESLIQPLAKLYSYVIEYQARVIFHLTSPQHSRAWQDVQGSNAWTETMERIGKSNESCRNLLQITTKSKIQDNRDQILQEIRKSHTTQEKTLQHLEESQKDHKEQELLHALAKAANNYEENMRRNPLRVRGTCEWILENEDFGQWRESSSGVLWVSAGPGRGKSVLSRSLIDEKHLDVSTITITSANVLTSPPPVVAHFFFKEGAGGNMDGAQALCAILWQLFWSPSTLQSTTLIKHALPRYKANGDSLVTNFPELWRILVACAADPDVGEIICVMDALDECEKESAHQIIETLHDFYRTDQASLEPKLKFLITSRPLQDLQDRFDGLSITERYLQLDGERRSEQIRHEIDLVIDEKIEGITKGFTESDRNKIKTRLKGMQSSTYLWLHLIFKIITNDRMAYSRCSDLETLLDDVPKEVSQVYERMLSRSKNKSRLKTLLELVLASRRPLTLDEANVALTLAVQDQEEQAFKSHEDLMAARWPSDQFQSYIMDLCGLFISVHEGKLSFIHQTAREFLTTKSKQGNEGGFWKGASNSPQSHSTISRQCMQYLLLPDNKWTPGMKCSYREKRKLDSIRNRKYPFLVYSAKYWALHFINQEAAFAEQYTEDARMLCDVTRPHFRTWAPVYHNILFNDCSAPVNLAVASYFGIKQVVRVLLDAGADVNVQDRWPFTALQAASRSGSQQVVQMLLDNGADVNAKHGYINTALQAASARGHQSIVEVLLNQGADVNIQGGEYNTALQAASARGHQKIVEILLNRGADVNIQGGRLYSTALQAASARGHQSIVEMLLNQGADVNLQGGEYDTALQAASTEGHQSIVEMLLNRGADVNIQGGDYGTALQAASARGHQRIVDILE